MDSAKSYLNQFKRVSGWRDTTASEHREPRKRRRSEMGVHGRERCQKKIVHPTLRKAHFTALKMRQRTFEESGGMDRLLSGYCCKYCGQFHVGHGSISPKIVDQIRAIEREYEREFGEIKVTTPHLWDDVLYEPPRG